MLVEDASQSSQYQTSDEDSDGDPDYLPINNATAKIPNKKTLQKMLLNLNQSIIIMVKILVERTLAPGEPKKRKLTPKKVLQACLIKISNYQ